MLCSGRTGGGLVLTVIGLVAAAACSSPTAPKPVSNPPSLTCPADQSAASTNGQPVAVSYPAPAISGGTAPVGLACAPPSGFAFPVGTATVTCTATDADQRTATCGFRVTVQSTQPPPAPVVAFTRYVAFGDSLTFGVTPFGGTVPMPYPADLQGMMLARYTAQSITVFNEGVPGELAVEGDVRLRSVLAKDNAQVVMILEGVNDLSEDPLSVPPMLSALQSMVRHAREAGVQVLLATLPPETTGSNPRARGRPPAIVASANDGIRRIASTESVPLVDLFQGLAGNTSLYVGSDGLHLTEAGYHRTAELFFDTVRSRFETVPLAPFVVYAP